MSDRSNSWTTSIIVGTIIALIGILTGLYIADNARQQLAAATQQTEQQETGTEKSASPTPQPKAATLDELPPLDPMEPEAEVPAPAEEPQEATQAEEPVEEPTATPQEEEQDTFEEVTPEELEELTPEQTNDTVG